MHVYPLDDEPTSKAEALPLDSADTLDGRVVRALEASPRIEVPADFAARVAARVPQNAPAPNAVTIRATYYGRSAILLGLAVLLVAMLLLAGRMANKSELAMILEWALFAQFVGLTIWFSTWHKGTN